MPNLFRHLFFSHAKPTPNCPFPTHQTVMLNLFRHLFFGRPKAGHATSLTREAPIFGAFFHPHPTPTRPPSPLKGEGKNGWRTGERGRKKAACRGREGKRSAAGGRREEKKAAGETAGYSRERRHAESRQQLPQEKPQTGLFCLKIFLSAGVYSPKPNSFFKPDFSLMPSTTLFKLSSAAFFMSASLLLTTVS